MRWLPLRTQVQILKQFKEIENGNLSILNITDAFVSDLYESGVNVELAKSQPKDFCNITHKFLLQKELLNETYQLLPTSESTNYNAVLFSLYTMFIAHARNNPSILFEYWVAIATIKNLLTILPYRSDQKKDTALFPSIEGVSDYSFIGQNKVYRDICSYLSTYIRATLNNGGQENKTPWGGTLIIKGLAEYAKKSLHATQDRIDVVFKGESLIRRQILYQFDDGNQQVRIAQPAEHIFKSTQVFMLHTGGNAMRKRSKHHQRNIIVFLLDASCNLEFIIVVRTRHDNNQVERGIP